jgi:multiple sugar transport system permease protein
VAIYLFDQFYTNTNLGYASAIAFVLFAVILMLTLIQRRALEQRVHYG